MYLRHTATMEQKQEFTEMETDEAGWFACWKYHQAIEAPLSLGYTIKIYEKMREHKEHYTNEQQLAVSSDLFTKLYRNNLEFMENLSKLLVGCLDERNEMDHMETILKVACDLKFPNMAYHEQIELDVSRLKTPIELPSEIMKIKNAHETLGIMDLPIPH